MDDDIIIDVDKNYQLDIVYQQFRDWYISLLEGKYQHGIDSKRISKWLKFMTYFIIIISGVNAFLSALKLVLTANTHSDCETSNEYLWMDIISLVISTLVSMVGIIKEMKESLPKKHTDNSNESSRIMDNIIKSFTPLNDDGDINLAERRDDIQQQIDEYNESAEPISSKAIKKFNKKKTENQEYIRKLKIINAIHNDPGLIKLITTPGSTNQKDGGNNKGLFEIDDNFDIESGFGDGRVTFINFENSEEDLFQDESESASTSDYRSSLQKKFNSSVN